MADEWIALSEAYELLLASEEDELLVQKLLIPALWEGRLPCKSMRVFLENKLQPTQVMVTIKEWPLDESPIVYDWANSRAVLPRGFYKPSREFAGIQFYITEYFRVKVSKQALEELFPEIIHSKEGNSRPVFRTGAAGKPTGKFVMPAEIERRAAAGERYKTLGEWGDILEKWYFEQYGDKAPPLKTKTIQNNFRSRLNQLLLR